jgi:mycothiol synthase
MASLTYRPAEPDDAPDLTALLNLLDVHAGGHPGYAVDDVRNYLLRVVRDLDANTRLVFTDDGELIAAAVTSPPPPDGYRVDLGGGVHPAWRGRRIGRELLVGQLTRAAEQRREAGASAPWDAQCTVMADDADGIRLFKRFGLNPIRYWFDMVARTLRPPAVPLPPVLRMVPYASEYEIAVHAAHNEAFTDHHGFQPVDLETWTPMRVRSSRFLAPLSRLVFDGDELAGYLLSYRDVEPGMLYIGQVGVRRPWRRRGLASALLADVMAAAAEDGMKAATLGVDADNATGAVGIYERVGFAVENRAVSYSHPLTD